MIQHVTREIAPSQLDACVTFYALFGFEQVAPPPELADRVVWIERKHTQIHLQPRPDARPQSGHIGVVIDGYQETIERLRSAGYEVDARAEHWGSPRSYVRDPAGNLVELMAWAPDQAGPETP